MTDPRRATGSAGEEEAARMLSALGYEVIRRNFRTRYGELDIVAVDGDCLVFCEVRSRVGQPAAAIGRALESVGRGKRLQLRRMAREWFRLADSDRDGAGPRTRTTRFDVVAVSLSADGRLLASEHVRDAF